MSKLVLLLSLCLPFGAYAVPEAVLVYLERDGDDVVRFVTEDGQVLYELEGDRELTTETVAMVFNQLPARPVVVLPEPTPEPVKVKIVENVETSSNDEMIQLIAVIISALATIVAVIGLIKSVRQNNENAKANNEQFTKHLDHQTFLMDKHISALDQVNHRGILLQHTVQFYNETHSPLRNAFAVIYAILTSDIIENVGPDILHKPKLDNLKLALNKYSTSYARELYQTIEYELKIIEYKKTKNFDSLDNYKYTNLLDSMSEQIGYAYPTYTVKDVKNFEAILDFLNMCSFNRIMNSIDKMTNSHSLFIRPASKTLDVGSLADMILKADLKPKQEAATAPPNASPTPTPPEDENSGKPIPNDNEVKS